MDLDFWPLDRRHIKTTTQPIRTAMEVVRIITNSRFSMITEVKSVPESEETLEGSILPLIIADINSNGDTLNELVEDADDDDCMI